MNEIARSPGLAADTLGRQYRGMTAPALDSESADWLQELAPGSAGREAAASRLHALLLRVTRAERWRRSGALPARGDEVLDDLCVQAANDALLSVLRKLGEFRGEARLTTWAAKFAIYEISTRLRRHAWRERRIETDERVWERLQDRAPPALAVLQHDELRAALARAVHRDLTERQRHVFQAAVLDEVPIDVLAERLETSRGAIYKMLHDARTRLRRALERDGFAGEGKEGTGS